MLESLIRFCMQHLNDTIGALSTIIAAIIPLIITGIVILTQRGGAKIHRHAQSRRKDKKGKQEEKARRYRGEEQLKRYAEGLKRHPDISRVHIMGMKQPLNLLDIYVHQRIHSESVVEFALAPALREAEETLDPNALFEVAQRSLEQRVDTSINIDEAIRQHHLCIIVGGPGAGKTTLLRYLALQSASHELVDLPSLPIYVQLSTFNPSLHKDLFGLIMAQLDGPYDTPETHELLREKMSNGEVLLLLDGLDETKIGNGESENHTYTYMVDAIKKLATIYEKMPIVVTVRKAGYQYHPKLPGFYELEVLDFRLEDSKNFVSRWFNATHTSSKVEKIKDLNMRLERNLRMQTIASNPLLLSLIVTVYEGHLDLPEHRYDLYKQCVEVLQTKWDASRDIQRHRDFPLTFQPELLQEVAWHFHNQGTRYFPIQELLRVIGDFLPSVDLSASKSEDVLEQIALENGLLREQAIGWYGFSHLTFQEYFVTQYIIANNKQEELVRHIDNPWWEEVLLLYVGSGINVSELLNILLGHDATKPLADDLFQTHLLLAGRCLGEKPRISNIALREEIIDNLFKILLTTRYMYAREHAANTLAMIGGARVNNLLLKALDSGDKIDLGVRESIGYALARYGERMLAPDLAKLLNTVTSRYIRIIVARALGVLGGLSVASILLHVLTDSCEDPYVRQSVALTLGTLGDQSSIPVLLELLKTMIDKDDENVIVQQGIVIALGTLGNKDIVDTLHTWLINEELDWYVRGSIAKALGMLGAQETIPFLIGLLQNNAVNSYVRQRIASSLILFEHTVIPTKPLFAILRDHVVNPGVRAGVAATLGCVGTTESVLELLLYLQDESTQADVRVSIANTLRYMDLTHENIYALNSLRLNPKLSENLYGSITATLGLLGERGVVYDLLKLMQNPDIGHDLLLSVAHALSSLSNRGYIDKHEIAHELTAMLSIPGLDRYRGQHAVKVLNTIGEPSIVPTLLSLLGNVAIDRAIRQSIAGVISQLASDNTSIDQLALLLSNTDIEDDIYRTLWIVSRHVEQKNSDKSFHK